MYFREEFRDAVRILEHDLDPESQNIVTKIKKWASESNIYLWIQPYWGHKKNSEQLNREQLKTNILIDAFSGFVTKRDQQRNKNIRV